MKANYQFWFGACFQDHIVPLLDACQDVGSTDTIAAGQIDLQGLGAVVSPRRGGRVETKEGVVGGVVRNDASASSNGTHQLKYSYTIIK